MPQLSVIHLGAHRLNLGESAPPCSMELTARFYTGLEIMHLSLNTTI